MRTLVPLDSRDLSSLACAWCGQPPSDATGGFKALRDGEVVGMIAVAPAPADGAHAPQTCVVRQLWVLPGHTTELIGTQLVQRELRDVTDRGIRFLVAPGTHGVPDCRHLPGAWLTKLGFVESVRGAQWRLDLRRTVRVRAAVRTAAETLARVVRLQKAAPANREG